MTAPAIDDGTCKACGCDGTCGEDDGYECDCDSAPDMVRLWLDRQHCKPGGVSKEARELLETVIADLEAGEF